MRIADALSDATEVLRESGVPEPRAEATLLFAFTLQKDKAFLIAHPEYQLTTDEKSRFSENLRRRAGREPFQYITGHQEFYGLDFEVTPDVLIPRPETELLVETALDALKNVESSRFCEVGIGSGCIAVTILYELREATAIGLDVSEKALNVSRRNAERHSVADRIELRLSDVFDDMAGQKFDLIASNPPYVPVADFESLQPEVRDFEPPTALTDGGDGLAVVRRIVRGAPMCLTDGGFLIMEFGFGQADKIRNMFSDEIWESVEFFPDLQGIPRTARAKKGLS